VRQQLGKLSNVTEVYPQIRFITDVHYAGKSESTSVLALPDSSRSSGAFEGMAGKYFSSPAADEAILQIEFAKLLSDQPASLVGRDLTLRYAERGTLSKDADDEALLDAMTGSGKPGGISIVPREKTLRIVGITESDPSAGIGGFGGARVYLPLKTAEQLHVAQPDDVQAFLSGNPAKRSYIAMTVACPFAQGRAASRSRDQTTGLCYVFLAGRYQKSPARIHGLRSLPRPLRKPRAHRCFARHHQHTGDGHPRTPPRDRHLESARRN